MDFSVDSHGLKRPRSPANQFLCPRKKRSIDTGLRTLSSAAQQTPCEVSNQSQDRDAYLFEQLINATQHSLPSKAQLPYNIAQPTYFHDADTTCAAISCDSPPCDDPTCDEGFLCHDRSDACESDACLGEVCWDKNCDDFNAGQCCDRPCEQTPCAEPCFSSSCNDADICRDDCMQSFNPADLQWDPFMYQPAVQHNAPYGYQPALSGITDALACGCIDPRCLESSYCLHLPGHSLDSLGRPNEQSTSICGAQRVSQKSNPTVAAQSSFRVPPKDLNLDIHSAPYLSGHQQEQHVHLDQAWADPGTPALTAASSITTPSSSISQTPRMTYANTQYQTTVTHCRCNWTDPHTGQVCSILFSNPADLHAHVEKAHVESLNREDVSANGFYCHWAGCDRFMCRSFAARPKLKRHLQTHTLHKPFECPTCGITMKTKDAMEKHERTHSGTRPYACEAPGCGKTFATSTELKTHTVVHSGEKPHVCGICGEAFADSSNLSKHKKTHFLGMWRCEVCGVRMKRWDQMRRHVQTQGHMKDLLQDLDVQKMYKARMEREWKELPDSERCLPPSRKGSSNELEM